MDITTPREPLMTPKDATPKKNTEGATSHVRFTMAEEEDAKSLKDGAMTI